MKIKKNIAVSESGFVFNPTTGDSFSLNGTGLELLQMLGSGKTSEEISRHFTATYDVEPSVFERYFLDFISMLKQYQIIESYEEG